MTRKEALAELIAKVEAGENPSQAEWAEVFPDTLDDDGYARSMMATQANVGWIDAAHTLHEAVLKDWWCELRLSTRPRAVIGTLEPEAEGQSEILSRAWLLAILRALHAMEAAE